MKSLKPLLISISIFSIFFFCQEIVLTQINTRGKTIAERFPPPAGYKRVVYAEKSFQLWLQNLRLKNGCPKIRLYNGVPLQFVNYHCAVIDIDSGGEDLQQCADSIIRLRAEYLFKMKRFDDLHFNFTSGDRCSWPKWRDGWRPSVRGSKVIFLKNAAVDDSYRNFRSWLDTVFTYAGTISISREFPKHKDLTTIRPGDFFVEAGSPGHAVIVVDVAVNKKTGKRLMLLAQGFMPAQEMHVLNNLSSNDLSPWYPADFGGVLETPRWDFTVRHLRRIPD